MIYGLAYWLGVVGHHGIELKVYHRVCVQLYMISVWSHNVIKNQYNFELVR